MKNKNYFGINFQQNYTDLQEEIREETLKLIQESEDIFDCENYKVVALHNNDLSKAVAILLDKVSDTFKVYLKDVEHFQIKDGQVNLKNIFKVQYMVETESELYEPLVFSDYFNVKESKKSNINNKESKKTVEENDQSKLRNELMVIKEFKNNGFFDKTLEEQKIILTEKELFNYDWIMDKKNHNVLDLLLKVEEETRNRIEVKVDENKSISPNPQTLIEYLNLLEEKTGFKAVYSEEDFISYTKNYGKKYESYIPTWSSTIDLLKEAMIKGDFTASKPFRFNDSDYGIFVENDKLCMFDQNISFIFDKKDNENYVIYHNMSESGGSNISALMEIYKKEEINTIKHVCVQVVNGKFEFVNEIGTYCIDLNIKFGFDAVKKSGFIEEIKELSQLKYIRNYLNQKYHANEIDVLYRAFMGLGTGIEYNEDTKGFNHSGVMFVANIPDAPETDLKKYYRNIFIIPSDKKQFSGLTDDWKEGLKKLVDYIDENKENIKAEYDEIFQSSDGMSDRQFKELEKNHKYLKTKLSKLKKNKVSP